MAEPTGTERRRLRVTGTVQGVGLRPFVYRTACALGLTGTVRNDMAGVLIDVEGTPARIAELCRCLVDDAPPLARIESVATVRLPRRGASEFRILESDDRGSPRLAVAIDTSTCAECLAEVDEPTSRRYRYPFTNCTNCGPRYTIIISLPYDRAATTMAAFTMCEPCRREYEDPGDRRFHAEPIACPACGPRLRFHMPGADARTEGEDALEAAAGVLERGGIVAVKGVGGFHLAVDAADIAAVGELRRRKARDDKPFALMVCDLRMARDLCELDDIGSATITSHRRPIVLAPRRTAVEVAPGVAPGLRELGLLLPYTPLHHLLLQRMRRPLVMTSGNLSDEPIASTDDEVFGRLSGLVDGVLSHDRGIHVRCDDSVVRANGGKVQILRRSRGYAPEPLRLAQAAHRDVLAVGAELKNTVAVATGTTIGASHHIGDLEHLAAYESFRHATEHLCSLFGVAPEVVAHDLHPEYLSTKWALDSGLPTRAVQHHHAHVASCLVEHGRTEPVVGIAFDGLGYGPDGTLWGGEFLAADLAGFERIAHLRSVPLPGGTAALREPWRAAMAWVHLACGPVAAVREGYRHDDRARSVLDMITGEWSHETTSVGRLFDAVAALLGVRSAVTYEGQAAIELEVLATRVPRGEVPAYECAVDRSGDMPVLDAAPLIARVLSERDRGAAAAVIAAGFHEGLGRAAARLGAELADARNVDTIALTGGVFQNVRLTEVAEHALHAEGCTVLVHRAVPPNDGGISIGQAAIAAIAEEPPHAAPDG